MKKRRGIPYLTTKSKIRIAIVIALGVILVALMLFAKLWSQSF